MFQPMVVKLSQNHTIMKAFGRRNRAYLDLSKLQDTHLFYILIILDIF